MATMAEATEFRLLGPLEVRVDGSAMPLGGAKQRTLLALLLVNAGDAVPVERIVDELWEAEPPASAAQSVQMHVSRLRKQLAASGNGDLLVTRPSGYAVAVDPERLDSDRFRRLLEHTRRHRDAGGSEPARALYEALRHPDPATTYQQAQFCDLAISADMDRARALQTSDPAAATALWTRIDHELVRRAPLIPLWTAYGTAASSRRLGNLQYAAGLGPLVDQAWVR